MSRLTDSVLSLGAAASLFIGHPQTPSTYLREGTLGSFDDVVGVVRTAPAVRGDTETLQFGAFAITRDHTHDAGTKLLPLTLEGPGESVFHLRLYRASPPRAGQANLRYAVHLADNGTENDETPVESGEMPLHSQAVNWIQDATGLSEARVGNLLDVSRMTVRNWKAGSAIQPEHRRRLFEVKDVLERAQRTRRSQDQLSAWLVIPDPITGVAPQALIEHGEFDKVRLLAVVSDTAVARTPAWAYAPIAESWAGYLETPERPGEFKDDLPEG